MKTPLQGCANPQGQHDGMREWQRSTSPSLKSSSQLCSWPKTMGHLTCDTSGEDTEPLRGQQLSEEDWVGLRIRPRPSCMLDEAGCLQPMQATPPADLYVRCLPGMIWKTKNAVAACSFPPCNCGSRDSQLLLPTVMRKPPPLSSSAHFFHLLINDHNVTYLTKYIYIYIYISRALDSLKAVFLLSKLPLYVPEKKTEKEKARERWPAGKVTFVPWMQNVIIH